MASTTLAPPSEPLSSDEVDCLRLIAREMIPASEEFGVPSADDPAIIAEVLRSLDRDRNELQRVLALVQGAFNSSGDALSPIERTARLAGLRLQEPGGFAVVEAVVSRAYYRDDRVLASIGMEARPPFPKGYDVEQIDLSILDPVRRRGRIYRDAGDSE